MTRPYGQFSIRFLLIVVALIALNLGLWIRAKTMNPKFIGSLGTGGIEFQSYVGGHSWQIPMSPPQGYRLPANHPQSPENWRRSWGVVWWVGALTILVVLSEGLRSWRGRARLGKPRTLAATAGSS